MKTPLLKIAGLSIILSSAFTLLASEVTKTIELDVDSSNDLVFIQNLVGNIDVTPSKDDKFHIIGIVTAEADNEKKANELLESIKFDTENKSGQKIISVIYPIDEYTGFIYNPNKKNGFWNNSNNQSKYMGERVRIATKPKGIFANWANVHTDMSIEVPADQLSKIKVVTGAIDAKNLDNNITLDTSSGKIIVLDSQGELVADTGSGRVTVENFNGPVNADTGSGGIELTNIKGDIDADTGSGGIKINTVTGRVKADTGSGSVKVQNFLGGDHLDIDTGSGSVRVDGDLGNLNELKIDTGSGSVALVTSHAPSLDIEVDTGSGGIDIDLPNMDVKRDKRGDFIATIGSGKGSAEIDTGSGGVSFRMDDSYQSDKKVNKQDQKSDSSSDDDEGKDNPALAAKVRAALNKNEDLRKSKFEVSARGDKVFVKGTVDSVWDVPNAIKVINNVEGVEDISIDIDTD